MSNNNHKPANVYIDVTEAKVLTEPKVSSNGSAYFKVACYTGGKGKSRQEIIATLFIDGECDVAKGNVIAFRGGLSQRAASDPKYGVDTTVNVEEVHVVDARKTVARPVPAPASADVADDEMPF